MKKLITISLLVASTLTESYANNTKTNHNKPLTNIERNYTENKPNLFYSCNAQYECEYYFNKNSGKEIRKIDFSPFDGIHINEDSNQFHFSYKPYKEMLDHMYSVYPIVTVTYSDGSKEVYKNSFINKFANIDFSKFKVSIGKNSYTIYTGVKWYEQKIDLDLKIRSVDGTIKNSGGSGADGSFYFWEIPDSDLYGTKAVDIYVNKEKYGYCMLNLSAYLTPEVYDCKYY